MKIHFLVEDSSGGKLIYHVMEKYNAELENNKIDYDIKPYKGIGGLKKEANAKSEQLLTELPKRLLAIQFQTMHIPDCSVFVVLDNDQRDTGRFYEELEEVARKTSVSMDHVFCIAVEEMESWLLGDFNALQKAYPKMRDRILSKYSSYKQDSICGTWEVLAEMLTPKGMKEFRKKHSSAYEIGKAKHEWAERIGSQMNIRENNSPSFRRFIRAIDERARQHHKA